MQEGTCCLLSGPLWIRPGARMTQQDTWRVLSEGDVAARDYANFLDFAPKLLKSITFAYELRF